MTNFEYYIKGNRFEEGWRVFVETSYNKIGRALKQYNNWLLKEHKEPILNDVEKEYLSKVIEPFRDKILYIIKSDDESANSYRIAVRVRTEIFNDGTDFLIFPNFDYSSKMYMNMKPDRRYTLKELNL